LKDVMLMLDEQPLRLYFSQSENFQVSESFSFQVNSVVSEVRTLISGLRMSVDNHGWCSDGVTWSAAYGSVFRSAGLRRKVR
jgi:hypothetical protein